MAWAKAEKSRESPLRLVLWAALFGLIIGLINAGGMLEDLARIARNKTHMTKASGDIVLVAIDDASLREVGRWPWPRRTYAQLIDRLHDAGAKRIFFDIIVNTKSTPADDQAFAAALKRAGNVTLPTQSREGPGEGAALDVRPLREFAQHAELAGVPQRPGPAHAHLRAGQA